MAYFGARRSGAVAQLGEHLVCNQGVTGSIPVRSMPYFECFTASSALTIPAPTSNVA